MNSYFLTNCCPNLNAREICGSLSMVAFVNTVGSILVLYLLLHFRAGLI